MSYNPVLFELKLHILFGGNQKILKANFQIQILHVTIQILHVTISYISNMFSFPVCVCVCTRACAGNVSPILMAISPIFLLHPTPHLPGLSNTATAYKLIFQNFAPNSPILMSRLTFFFRLAM